MKHFSTLRFRYTAVTFLLISQVEFPNKTASLVLLPARFNKKLWIRKGSYLIVEQATEQLDSKDKARISGTIEAVLYDHDLAALQKQGCWCAPTLTRIC